MQQRLCGREQEFGIQILPPLKGFRTSQIYRPHVVEDDPFRAWRKHFIRAIFTEINRQSDIFCVPYGTSEGISHIWFSNGSLIYADMGDLLEIATAECPIGSLDGILQEKATELILSKAAESVVANFNLKAFWLYKNNVGPKPDAKDRFDENSYGSHQNYSYLDYKNRRVTELFTNFLPVSLFLSGNGHVYKDRFGNFLYLLSQRAFHIQHPLSSSTTQDRALVNIRNEPLMSHIIGLGRFHLISRDATRCEFQTWLVDTVTHLMLRLAEEDWELPYGWQLNNPIWELHNINLYLSIKSDYKVRCGFMLGNYGGDYKEIDLMDYARIFLDAAKQLRPLSEAEKKCLQEWERVLGLFEARAFDKLVGELDWATKWWLLKKKMAKEKFGLNDIRAWKIDMEYHNISLSPERSWFARLDQDGYIKHLVSRDDVEKAKTTAPDTRAKSREKFIKLCHKYPWLKRRVAEFQWDSVRIKEYRQGEKIHFGGEHNPFSPHSPTLEQLCRDFNLSPT